MSTARILIRSQDDDYMSLTDADKRASLSDYTSDISWEAMPSDLKNIMGSYLLKPDVLYPKPTTSQIRIALSDRKNIDLPYVDRNDEDSFKWTMMPFEKMYAPRGVVSYCAANCFHQESDPQSREEQYNTGCCDEGPKYKSGLTGKGGAACCVGTLSLSCVIPASILGLFVDGGRAVKRKCNDAKDEALHREVIGPIRQVMP